MITHLNEKQLIRICCGGIAILTKSLEKENHPLLSNAPDCDNDRFDPDSHEYKYCMNKLYPNRI